MLHTVGWNPTVVCRFARFCAKACTCTYAASRVGNDSVLHRKEGGREGGGAPGELGMEHNVFRWDLGRQQAVQLPPPQHDGLPVRLQRPPPPCPAIASQWFK